MIRLKRVLCVAYLGKVNRLITKLRNDGKQTLILGSLEDTGKSTSRSRKQVVGALRVFDYDKVALFGDSKYIRHISNFIITANGREDKVKLFKNKEAAVKWLKR